MGKWKVPGVLTALVVSPILQLRGVFREKGATGEPTQRYLISTGSLTVRQWPLRKTQS